MEDEPCCSFQGELHKISTISLPACFAFVKARLSEGKVFAAASSLLPLTLQASPQIPPPAFLSGHIGFRTFVPPGSKPAIP